jgi:DNA-binding XRE family transcriptional regulator
MKHKNGGDFTERNTLIALCNEKLRLVRSEVGYSQDRMATTLGLSKKTLLEIEKGRVSLGWTGCVALCALFRHSEILGTTLACDPYELVMALAETEYKPKPESPITSFLWSSAYTHEGYRIDQNLITQHFRLFSPSGELLAASFSLDDLKEQIPDITKGGLS